MSMHKTIKTGTVGPKKPPSRPADQFSGVRVNAWGVPVYQVKVGRVSFDIGGRDCERIQPSHWRLH